MGLAINDSKTITWKRGSYETSLHEADALRQRIANEANLNLTQFDYDEYSDDISEVPPEPNEVERMAAESILERWSKLAGYGVRTGPRKGEYRALRELGTLALATLSGDPETNPIVLQNILRLLRFERTFTPIFARYLGERDDAAMVLDAFDKLLKSRAYLNGWQAWWLEHTVAK